MSQWALLSAVLRNRMFTKDHAVKQSMATHSKVFQQVLMSLMQSHFE